ncbi:patatin-like phospholipase family protein [Roseiarcaceae bacterium H3SJ34-1]|uniref:patatin-like phospholipase family protein n=1 Tax=Terripilifer ovatus TaxID=3032367 RepID=UPI003AB9B5EC|nr:patatin-like phospholipase family protein [Roseiarcaceae bacterium H3SJ34-1]
MGALPPIRVLSLDGGGMRGTYTATYLDRVAAAFAKRRGVDALDIGAAFDLIVGTSTGGIVACALAAGVPLSQVVSLYSEHGAAIFSRPLPGGIAGLPRDILRRPSALEAGEAVLRAALGKTLGSVTIGEIYAARGIALAVTAVEMSQHHAWVFKTPHFAATNHRDDNTTLVDVCLATSAAPIFRSMAAVKHADAGSDGYNVFVDGGLWSNNPVLVGLIDALDMAAPGQKIEIYSLGTCPMPAGEQIPRDAVHRGLPQWHFGGDAASLAIDAQQFAYDHMAKKLARHLNHPCTVLRFPSDKVPAALIPYLGLDDTRPEAIHALINQARTDADATNSKCAYHATDPEAALICALFETAPARTDPLFARKPTLPSEMKDARDANHEG